LASSNPVLNNPKAIQMNLHCGVERRKNVLKSFFPSMDQKMLKFKFILFPRVPCRSVNVGLGS
jgi:hypothetical protein